jgi:hypothetical protein
LQRRKRKVKGMSGWYATVAVATLRQQVQRATFVRELAARRDNQDLARAEAARAARLARLLATLEALADYSEYDYALETAG